MRLLTPEPGLFVWTILSGCHLLLMFAALLHLLFRKNIGRKESLSWAVIVVFIPLIGPLLYFKASRQIKQLH